MVSAIEQNLLKATGEAKKRKGESDQGFMLRLLSTSADLSDDDWRKLLSAESQQWFNDAAIAANRSKDLPPFSKYESKSSKRTKSMARKPKEPELQVGMEVTFVYEGDDVEGEVEKVTRTSITVDGDRFKRSLIEELEIEEYDEEDEEDTEEEGDEEDEEEGDEGDEEDEEGEYDVDQIEVGDEVELVLKDDEEVSGTVEKVLKASLTIDGERVKKADVEEVVSISRDEEDEEDEEETEGGDDPADVAKGDSVTLDLTTGKSVTGTVTRVIMRDGDLKGFYIDGTRYGMPKIESLSIAEKAPEKSAPKGRGRYQKESRRLKVHRMILVM